MRRFVCGLLILFVIFSTMNVNALILQFKNGTKITFTHQTAAFGPFPGQYSVSAPIILGSPMDGCYIDDHSTPEKDALSVLSEPVIVKPDDIQANANYSGKVVLFERGNCSFAQKVFYAQKFGAVGVVVGDNLRDTSIYIVMSTTGTYSASDFHIPSVFILREDFVSVRDIVYRNTGSEQDLVGATLDETGEYDQDLSSFLKYAAALRILSIILMTLPSLWCAMAALIILRRMLAERNNASRRRFRLLHIPSIPFHSSYVGDRNQSLYLHNSNCAICLDEFEDGMEIKRLDCSHAFHSSCIDPWLENRSDLCPICKRSILEGHLEELSQWEERWMTFKECFCCCSSRRYQRIHVADPDFHEQESH